VFDGLLQTAACSKSWLYSTGEQSERNEESNLHGWWHPRARMVEREGGRRRRRRKKAYLGEQVRRRRRSRRRNATEYEVS